MEFFIIAGIKIIKMPIATPCGNFDLGRRSDLTPLSLMEFVLATKNGPRKGPRKNVDNKNVLKRYL